MDLGETYPLQVEFHDGDEQLYNPDDVYTRVLGPDGSLSSPAMANPSTGLFTADVPLTQKGIVRGWVHGEGPGDAIVIVPFSVCVTEAL